MSRICDRINRIKSLLSKKTPDNNNNSVEQPKRSEEELEMVCKSKSLLQKTQDSIKEIWLLCMEPFM